MLPRSQGFSYGSKIATASKRSGDVKNPHTPEAEHTLSSAELLALLHESFAKSDALLNQLKRELGQ